MNLAELRALDFQALWSGLTPGQQAAIGSAAIAQQFALLVGEDRGDETDEGDRRVAQDMASEAYDGMADAVEEGFPNIEWWDE